MKFHSDSLARIMLASAAVPIVLMRGAPPSIQPQGISSPEQTHALITDIRELMHHSMAQPPAEAASVHAHLTAIQIALAQIASVTDAESRKGPSGFISEQSAQRGPLLAHPCDEHATLFVSGDFMGLTVYCNSTILILGDEGQQQFTFASGTALTDVVAAINTFTAATGVSADTAFDDPAHRGFNVRAIDPGSQSEVVLVQIDGDEDCMVTYQSPGGPPSHFDFGDEALPGDADCDLQVGPADLKLVLDAWGPADCGDQACAADFSKDGIVNPQDLAILLGHWSQPNATMIELTEE